MDTIIISHRDALVTAKLNELYAKYHPDFVLKGVTPEEAKRLQQQAIDELKAAGKIE